MLKIVCESCTQTAAPGALWKHGEKIALECALCGHLHRLQDPEILANRSSTTTPPSAASIASNSVESVTPRRSPEAAPSDTSTQSQATLDTVERCPKCAAPQNDTNSCARCGLLFSKYRPGEMSWEVAPEGKEEAWEEAQRHWTTLKDDFSSLPLHEVFEQHCLISDLEDFSSRSYRLYLVQHPDDEEANTRLERIAARGRETMLNQLASDRVSTHRYTNLVERGAVAMIIVVVIVGALLFFWHYPNLLG